MNIKIKTIKLHADCLQVVTNKILFEHEKKAIVNDLRNNPAIQYKGMVFFRTSSKQYPSDELGTAKRQKRRQGLKKEGKT